MHVVCKLNPKHFVCFSMVMNFTGAKFLRDNLKETRDMTIFVLLCKNTIRLCSNVQYAIIG